MGRKRQQHSADFKFRVALAAVREVHTACAPSFSLSVTLPGPKTSLSFENRGLKYGGRLGDRVGSYLKGEQSPFSNKWFTTASLWLDIDGLDCSNSIKEDRGRISDRTMYRDDGGKPPEKATGNRFRVLRIS